MSRVLVNGLNVRAGPSTGSQSVAHYDAGQMINSGNAIILNEGRKWLRYTGSSGNQRYVCAINNDGSRYVDYPPHLPEIPYNLQNVDSGWTLTAYCSCSQCCGKSDGITASGYQLKSSDHLRICAAPKNIPFNTVINISGGWNGTVVVKDRGGAIKGKRLDIFCKSHQEANQFGRKPNCTISY